MCPWILTTHSKETFLQNLTVCFSIIFSLTCHQSSVYELILFLNILPFPLSLCGKMVTSIEIISGWWDLVVDFPLYTRVYEWFWDWRVSNAQKNRVPMWCFFLYSSFSSLPQEKTVKGRNVQSAYVGCSQKPDTNIWAGYRKVKDGLFLGTLAINLIVFGSHLPTLQQKMNQAVIFLGSSLIPYSHIIHSSLTQETSNFLWRLFKVYYNATESCFNAALILKGKVWIHSITSGYILVYATIWFKGNLGLHWLLSEKYNLINFA